MANGNSAARNNPVFGEWLHREVVYEMDDLRQFSDLVADLRAVEGRIYTLRDTPLHTGLWRPPEETLALFR